MKSQPQRNPEKPTKSKQTESDESDYFEEDDDSVFKETPNKYANVTVQATEAIQNKKNPNKSLYVKKHACAFCDLKSEQIIRHIEAKHSKEPEVIALKKCEKNTKERAKLTKLLKYKGNFKANIKVLKENNGTLIVVRRPKGEEDASKFVPCAACLGFYSKCELYRHDCVADKDKKPERHLLRESRILLSSALDNTSPLLAEVLVKMVDDEISQVAKNDPLILKMMGLLLEKHDSKQQNQIRQKARDISRLLLHVRKHREGMAEIDLRNLLIPENFDDIILSVNELCKDIASLPLKLGQIIPKLISILQGEAIRKNDTDLESSCKRFTALMDSPMYGWADRISLKSRKRLHDKKLHKEVVMPSSEGVTTFCEKLEAEADKRFKKFKKNPGVETGRKLSEAVLAEIIALNMRRGGEASRIETETYKFWASTWENRNFDNELYCSLTETQKENAKKHFLVKSTGKCGTHVPSILTYKMKEKVDYLLLHRDKLGIPEENKYLFAIPGHQTHLCSWNIIRKFCEEFKVENLTTTSLRKYLATSAQAVNFSDKDVSHLARHLGHTVQVHQRHYRQHLDVIEIGKMATVLHATQQGVLHLQKDKTLDNMEVPEWDLEEAPPDDDLPSDGSNEDEPEVQPSTSTATENQRPTKVKRKPRVVFKKITRNERAQILDFFKINIEASKLPGQKQCKRYINENTSSLEWQQVKSVVHSKLQCLKKSRGKGKDDN